MVIGYICKLTELWWRCNCLQQSLFVRIKQLGQSSEYLFAANKQHKVLSSSNITNGKRKKLISRLFLYQLWQIYAAQYRLDILVYTPTCACFSIYRPRSGRSLFARTITYCNETKIITQPVPYLQQNYFTMHLSLMYMQTCLLLHGFSRDTHTLIIYVSSISMLECSVSKMSYGLKNLITFYCSKLTVSFCVNFPQQTAHQMYTKPVPPFWVSFPTSLRSNRKTDKIHWLCDNMNADDYVLCISFTERWTEMETLY